MNRYKTIYILFEGVNAVKNAKVHGGGSFSRWISKELKNDMLNNNYRICVLWPKGVKPQTIEENEIYSNECYGLLEVTDVFGVPFIDGDVLFVPIMESCHVDLVALKKSYPFLSIRIMIHGMRNCDLARFDKYQVYFHKWYKPFPGISTISFIRQLYHKLREIKQLRSACTCADRVYTVSNNSMQLINKYCSPQWIKYYHQASVIPTTDHAIENIYPDKYALIINSNRNEKNAIRTLIAFCQYKHENPDDVLKLYMVGATSLFKQNLKKVKEIDAEILSNQVVLFDYVTSKELSDLFSQCYFLLYPSKSEGYGLPLLDAMEKGRPVVASSITSVPEVLGTAGYYVNPYDTTSIKNGIAFMNNTENNILYQKRIEDIKPLIHLRQKIDTIVLVRDIVE